MKVAATLLILCLDLIAGQTPKRLQIASMTAKIGRDGTGKLKSLNMLKIFGLKNHGIIYQYMTLFRTIFLS